MKPIERRTRATEDIELAVDFYGERGGAALALAFLDALDTAFAHVGKYPGTDSPRYAEMFEAANLRFWSLKRFPYAVFYVEHIRHIAVLRVLHQASDIPDHLNSDFPSV